MKVYMVGEHCIYEGGGWDVLIADNENLLSNIKKVIIESYEEELKRYTDWEGEEDGLSWSEYIEHLSSSIKYIKGCSSVDEIKGHHCKRDSMAVTIRCAEVIE